MTYFQNINNLIRTMHYRYGVGDLKSIYLACDGTIELIAKGYGMRPHKRRGRITRNPITNSVTVRLYRHQRTVKVI